MPTDYDPYLAAVLDEPAEAAQTIYPRNVGSMFSFLRRRAQGGTIERNLKRSNLLAVTADRVLIYPQHLARGTGLTLEPAILDWDRTAVEASGDRRCHLFRGDGNTMEGQGSDYVLATLECAGETVRFEIHRKGHQKIARALRMQLTGAWS